MHHLLEIWFGWVLARRIHRHHRPDGDGELDHSGSERSRDSAGGLSRGPRGSELRRRHLGWDLRLLPRRRDYLLGFVLGRPSGDPAFREIFSSSRQDKLERAEVWLERYEAGGVFFARLLPVIRHLISIPAGIVRMNFWIFSVVTIVGSALWCAVLAYLGDKAYRAQPDLISNPEGLVQLIKAQSHWIVLFVAVLAILYLLVLRLSAKRSTGFVATRSAGRAECASSIHLCHSHFAAAPAGEDYY